MLDRVETERSVDPFDRRYPRRSGGTTPRLAALVCCTALLAMSASALAQADCAAAPGGWPPGDWTVVCTNDVIAGLDQTDNLVEGGLWSDQVCSASTAGTPAALARETLTDAAAWLVSLCFKPPTLPIESVDGQSAWKASLARAATRSESGGYDAGVYKDGELFVNYDYFVGEGDFSGSATDFVPGDDGLATLVHELFHAVQVSYSDPEKWHRWVVEGTAEAAELAWKKRRGLTSRGQTRYFDDPLHRPRNRDHAYRTSIFWLWLGRRFGSPSEIAYLHEMFKIGDFVAGYGLKDFDTFLFRRDTSLYEIFPAFIAERVSRPVMYSDGNRSVSIRYEEPKAEETHRGRVAVLAADPVTVNVEVPSDKLGELTIKLRENDDDLHLIVDDQVLSGISPFSSMPADQREKKPHLRDARWQAERNRFVGPVGGGDTPSEFFVRVARVKEDDNEASSSPKAYTLDIELEPLGECDFSASLSGDTSKTSARGNVAHFSTGGGATVQGMLSNPENIDRMSGFLEAFGGGASDEEKARMRESAERWKAEAAQMPQETLGISLLAMDTNASGDAILAQAIGGFKLQLSVMDQPIEPGFKGALEPSLVVVHTGDWTDDVSRQIRYSWAPGAPGSASVNISRYSKNVMTGTLSATLEGQGVYKEATGEPPVINLTASFQAVRHNPLAGELGCITRN